MKQSSKRLASFILALLFIVVALIVLFDLIQPEYGAVMDAKGQLAGEQAFLVTETAAVAQAQTLISAFKNQSQNEQNVALAMPPTEDLAGALAQIYGLAQNDGLTIQTVAVSAPTFQAQPVVPVAAAASTNALSGSGVPSNAAPRQIVKPLAAVTFQINAAGSYEGMKNFISGLETNVRIFDLKGLAVAPVTGAGAFGAKDFFDYNITVAAYYQTQ